MILWFASYLFGRRFVVRYMGCKSTVCNILSGVPQGSNLGPLLFIIYINDIGNSLNCPFLLYADDIKIFCNVQNGYDHAKLQADINSIHAWSINNRLPLNMSKTKVVSYSRKTNVSMYQYRIDDYKIEVVSTVKDLGVTIDNKLLFNEHIDKILSKARRNLGLIKWVARDFNDLLTCKILYCAYVRSHLEYAALIWNRNLITITESLEAIQISFLAWLRFKFKFDNLTNDAILSKLNLLSLAARRSLQEIKFVHNIIDGKNDLIGLLHIRAPSHISRNHRLFSCDKTLNGTPIYKSIITVNKNLFIFDIFMKKFSDIKDRFTKYVSNQ